MVREVLHQFAKLSTPRQALIRLCQSVNFGQVLALSVRNGDPVFSSETSVLLDLRLDTDEAERPELSLMDFALCSEVRRLLAHLDQLENGTLERIEVRSGVPRRVVIARLLSEVKQ